MSTHSTYAVMRFFLLAVMLLSGLTLKGQTNTWNNMTGDGLWSTNGNWSEGVAPTSSHDVRFNGNINDDNCTIDVSPTVKTLVFNNGYAGNVNLGSNTLSINGNFTVQTAGQFTAGTGSKVIITDAATINSPASVYDLEVNAQSDDNVVFSNDFTIDNDFIITEVSELRGMANTVKVGGDIILNDANLDGNCIISATGASSTITGTQWRNLDVAAGASLELLSDITLNSSLGNFTFTGSGNITGANKLIFGRSGTVNFSGTVSNIQVNTDLDTRTVTLSRAIAFKK